MWIIAILACWAPISYAISPPDMPEREELLEKDREGVARPKESAKGIVWGKLIWIYEVIYSLITAYVVVIFVGSWFY